MNVCNFIGRAGKDADTRYTPNGKEVTSWSIAVDSGFGDKKQTLWIDCTAWGERFGKVAEYIKKGSQLGVSGELGKREHEGKTYLTLRVADVTLCGAKREESAAPARAPKTHQTQSSALDDDGDSIPF